MQESFSVFLTQISLYPTVIFTGLVMFVTLYWVVSLIGLADMDSVDLGDAGGDVDVSDLSSTGVFTVSCSSLVFMACRLLSYCH